MWGATSVSPVSIICKAISIHAPRVGRDRFYGMTYAQRDISIHAPRVGRDEIKTLEGTMIAISIHAPRVGRDNAYNSLLYARI